MRVERKFIWRYVVALFLVVGLGAFVGHFLFLGVGKPFLADYYFNKGQYYFNHGDHADGTYDVKRAKWYYEKAVSLDQRADLLLWHQLGRLDFLAGRYDDALAKFARQQELFGDELPNVYYMMALTYGYKARDFGNPEDWNKAGEHFRTYLTFDPESPWAHTDLAWVLFSQGKFEEMLPVVEEGISYTPTNPWLLNMFGLALYNTDREEEAFAVWDFAKQEAQKLTPEDWGLSYPGNDPDLWPQGLEEFRTIIDLNLSLPHQSKEDGSDNDEESSATEEVVVSGE